MLESLIGFLSINFTHTADHSARVSASHLGIAGAAAEPEAGTAELGVCRKLSYNFVCLICLTLVSIWL